MKICIKSDIHHEFYRSGWPVCSAETADADVLVLAGDIDTGTDGVAWAEDHVKIPVIYVPGNHEFYGHERNQLLRELRYVSADTHVHVLDRDAVVINGVRFLGATLWTDYKLNGAEHQASSAQEANYGLNDHHTITERGTEPGTERDADGLVREPSRFMPSHALREHEASVAWLREQLAMPFSGKTVVVTHHGPNEQSVAPRFRGGSLSPAFVSNLAPDLFEVPALWCHGHVHDSFDYRIGACRVVANPRGYPLDRRSPKCGFENESYQETLVVEI